jgi:hypothetical protein
MLRSAGWYATATNYYFDQDEQRTREVDLYACISHDEVVGRVPVLTWYMLNVEVKKTERPWVILGAPIDEHAFADGWNSVIAVGNSPATPLDVAQVLESTSLARELGWVGHGIHEAFKRPGQPSRWYPAFVSVCKAAEQTLELNSLDEPSVWMVLIRPLVVVDGELFYARPDSAGRLGLEFTEQAVIHFEFRSAKYQRRGYLVDVVRLDALPGYLRFSRDRYLKLHALMRERAAGVEQWPPQT